MLQELAREAAHVLACGVESLYRLEDRRYVAAQDRARKALQRGAAHEAEHAERVLLGDLVALERDELVEGRERVAHAALGAARDCEESVLLGGDALLAADVLEPRDDVVRLDAPQVEALAARDDCRQHLVALGRREYEPNPRRRFLERLEERVPRRVGEHVALVDDEYLVLRGRRLELHRLDDRLHVLHLVVRGRV